jgi:hypothetical protein
VIGWRLQQVEMAGGLVELTRARFAGAKSNFNSAPASLDLNERSA